MENGVGELVGVRGQSWRVGEGGDLEGHKVGELEDIGELGGGRGVEGPHLAVDIAVIVSRRLQVQPHTEDSCISHIDRHIGSGSL